MVLYTNLDYAMDGITAAICCVLLFTFLVFVIFKIQPLQPLSQSGATPLPVLNSISCYRLKDVETLPDISIEKLEGKESIFFLETSCKSYEMGKIAITARQACSVESAARVNPDWNIFVLFASPGVVNNTGSRSDRILKALLSYRNVIFRHMDYEKYTKETLLENLYKNKKIEESPYGMVHASDILRMLTLWKYGGTYLDLDVIVIKPLKLLNRNYIVVESSSNLASGVINLTPNGSGHHFATEYLTVVGNNYKAYTWSENGNGIITSLLQKYCNAKTVMEMVGKTCEGIKIYPSDYFYAVPWWTWRNIFDKAMTSAVSEKIKNSYGLHVWNALSKETKVQVNDSSAYTVLAKKFCPKVFTESIKYTFLN